MIIAGSADKIKDNSSEKKWLAAAALSIFIILWLKNSIHTSLLSAWALAVPSICLLIAFYRDEGKAAKILHAKPFQMMGNISFELYMSHAFVYEGLPIAVGVVSDDMGKWLVNHAGVRFLITTALSFLAAWIINVAIRTINSRNRIKIDRRNAA